MARLDHLGPIKETVQIASVIGRTFRQDVLASVMALEDSTIEAALDRLVESGLVYRRGVVDGLGFEFKHALMREAAYHSILKSRRKHYHARTAEALEVGLPDTAEPELIAYHYTEAGNLEKAIACGKKAAKQAMSVYAHDETVSLLEQVIQLQSQFLSF